MSRYDAMHVTLTRTVAPTAEPVSVTDAKDYLRIDSSDEDALIANLIKTARAYGEKYTRRAFINQTWKMELEDFPRDSGSFVPGFPRISGRNYIQLPKRPLSSVTSIKYYDTSDTLQTFAASNYLVEQDRVYLVDTQTWPSDVRDGMPVEILFVAGYGAQATDVPSDLRYAMQEHVAFLYENRGGKQGMVPDTTKAVYDQYRVTAFGGLMG